MTEAADSRVEFFSSQSSFGSASNISNSRLDFQFDEMIMTTDNFFETLKATLRPDPDNNKQQVWLIINRAKIMSNETMPNYINLINRKKRPTQHLHSIKEHQRRLLTLIEDYKKSQESRPNYDYFYEKYSAALNKFSKKVGARNIAHHTEQITFPAKPDVVTIVEYSPHRVGANSNYRVPKTPVSQSRAKDTESKQLSTNQVIDLKNKIKELQINHARSQDQLKVETAQRIQQLINTYSNNQNQNSKALVLENELRKRSNQFLQLNRANKELVIQIQELNRRLDYERQQNQRLKQWQQSEEEQKRRNQDSRMSQDGNKSIHSEYNPSNDDQLRKIQKNFKNLEYQNELLKNQLKKQRDLTYNRQKRQATEQQKENIRLKNLVDSKSKQLKEVKMQLDRFKVQNIKLKDYIDKVLKKIELQKIVGPGKSSSNFYQSQENLKVKGGNQQIAISSQPTIQQYVGDGNQNLPYYEFLNKQHRIRFRRSCLKEKQLLHKSSGLEVGVISSFTDPNQLKICLYLANIDNLRQITNLKLKVTNSKNNKVFIQNSQINQLHIQQQSKTYISVPVKSYPMGCTVLICEYNYYDKLEQIRILLPVHVFKMLKFKGRTQKFVKPVDEKAFALQKKIGKDISAISPYFKGAIVEGNTLKMLIFHEHSQTFLICDVVVQNGYMSVIYEHKSGDEHMTNYIIKSLQFLFKKEIEQ